MLLRAMLLLQALIWLQEAVQQQQAAPVTPAMAELASRLLEESCHSQVDNFTSFYLRVRERQAAEREFPLWPYGNKIRFLEVYA